jgi:hypothetical protein
MIHSARRRAAEAAHVQTRAASSVGREQQPRRRAIALTVSGIEAATIRPWDSAGVAIAAS